MATVVSIVNQKGGVGKTTTAVNLCHGLARAGKKVLAVDLDPQSNLTVACGYFNADDIDLSRLEELNKRSVYEVLKGSVLLNECLVEIKGFHLLPGSLYLAAADLEFSGLVGRELLLRARLDPIMDDFDYVIIDCPPNLGLLSLNALAASHKILIPVQSEFLSLFGVRQLLDTVDQIKKMFNPNLELLGVVVTMFDKRKKLSKAVLESIKNYFGDLVFSTVINENVSLAEAPSRGMSIFEYAPKSQGAEDYDLLVKEILNGKEIQLSAESA